MAVLSQSFENGTHGIDVTAGNSTPSGTAISPLTSGAGTITYTSTPGELIAGTLSAKCYAPSGSYAYANWNGSATRGGFYVKHRLPLATATGAVQVIRSSAQQLLQVQLYANRRLAFSVNGVLVHTTTQLTLPGVYVIDTAISTGTNSTDGRAKFAVYDVNGNFAGGLTEVLEFTNIDAGSGASIAYLQAGKCNNTTDESNYIIDDMRAITGSYAFGSATDLPPEADAGINQTAEPWSTVTLDGSQSTDPDGTVTSWNWSQTSGTAVTLSGTGPTRTFEAPAAIAQQSLDFSLTVSDGIDSSLPDTVTVTVMPTTERAVTGGQEVPLRIRSISS